jgi:Transposase DDE domain/Insertion element 4 transposase N-terminal
MKKRYYRHPEFPAFRQKLAPMKAARAKLAKAQPLHQLEQSVGALLPQDSLREIMNLPGTRMRWLPLHIIFWAFLAMVLNPRCSCRESQRGIQAWWKRQGRFWTNPNTNSFCEARKRLPLAWLRLLWWRMADRMSATAPTFLNVNDHRVLLVDGTTILTPDTASNQGQWPQPSSQKKGCGFPQIRIVGLFCLKTGVLLRAVHGALAASEQRLFALMRPFLRPGDIVVGDRGFWSFVNLAFFLKRNVDAIFRARNVDKINWKEGKALGKKGHKDRLITMPKPKAPSRVMGQRLWKSLNRTIQVRIIEINIEQKGFRSKSIVIATTLIDPVKWPASVIARLYLRRWRVELNFRDLKTTMQAEMVRCKSPAMIRKELVCLAIAYNLIRKMMIEAAEVTGAPLDRMSFKGTMDTFRAWASEIGVGKSALKRAEAYIDFLILCGLDELPDRPGRSEPRCVKRRPKPYQLMTAPRSMMKISKTRGSKSRPQKKSNAIKLHKSWAA